MDITNITSIARICHEANRALCLAAGDDSQVPWDDAPSWQRKSTFEGVLHAQQRRSTPDHMHTTWCESKRADGWTYGPVKDAEAKTHPCLVPYTDLPEHDRLKDTLFLAIVKALS